MKKLLIIFLLIISTNSFANVLLIGSDAINNIETLEQAEVALAFFNDRTYLEMGRYDNYKLLTFLSSFPKKIIEDYSNLNKSSRTNSRSFIRRLKSALMDTLNNANNRFQLRHPQEDLFNLLSALDMNKKMETEVEKVMSSWLISKARGICRIFDGLAFEFSLNMQFNDFPKNIFQGEYLRLLTSYDSLSNLVNYLHSKGECIKTHKKEWIKFIAWLKDPQINKLPEKAKARANELLFAKIFINTELEESSVALTSQESLDFLKPFREISILQLNKYNLSTLFHDIDRQLFLLDNVKKSSTGQIYYLKISPRDTSRDKITFSFIRKEGYEVLYVDYSQSELKDLYGRDHVVFYSKGKALFAIGSKKTLPQSLQALITLPELKKEKTIPNIKKYKAIAKNISEYRFIARPCSHTTHFNKDAKEGYAVIAKIRNNFRIGGVDTEPKVYAVTTKIHEDNLFEIDVKWKSRHAMRGAQLNGLGATIYTKVTVTFKLNPNKEEEFKIIDIDIDTKNIVDKF